MSITNLEILKDGELADVSPLNNNFETLRVGVNGNTSLITNLTTKINNLVNNVNELTNKLLTSLLPIGSKVEVFSLIKNPEECKLFLCDFSEVSRTVYPELFNIIGTKYGVGDGTTTFNLPDCMNNGTYSRAYTPNLTEEIGKIQDGGLPNITGGIFQKSTNGHDLRSHSWSGALSKGGGSSAMMRSEGGGWYDVGISIDASRSSPLYGASDNEVRTKNYAVYVYIRY